MSIVVTGSIATDNLMTFRGRFADQLVPEALHQISLSFLVDDLQVRRGGIGANIAFGMANLGLHPVLVGSVGDDFDDYRSWLERHGVDTASVRVSTLQHTARFLCTTDSDQNQIASFYTGAMSEARAIELAPIVARHGEVDLVVISPNDPDAMLRHTDECRTRGYPFAADPSQQLAVMDGAGIRLLVDGAAYLFTNEYEAALTEQKTGWTAAEILERVQVRVTTLGSKGSRIDRAGHEPILVKCAQVRAVVEPTGVGDAYRAGFLAATAWGLSLERSAQVGSLLAAYVIETVGTQEYDLSQSDFLARFADAYGVQEAVEVGACLRCPRP